MIDYKGYVKSLIMQNESTQLEKQYHINLHITTYF
jgi:hypothetical protein